MIAGCKALCSFIGRVFAMLISNNVPVIGKPSLANPRLNQAFVEYLETRGFVSDLAKVRNLTDLLCSAMPYTVLLCRKLSRFWNTKSLIARQVSWFYSPPNVGDHDGVL